MTSSDFEYTLAAKRAPRREVAGNITPDVNPDFS